MSSSNKDLNEPAVVHLASGLQPNVDGRVLFIDANHIAYVSGNRIVILSLQTRGITVLPESDEREREIVAIAACKDNKLLGVSKHVRNQSSEISIVNLSSLQQIGLLKYNEGKDPIRGITFANDGKTLVGYVSNFPHEGNTTVLIWNVTKNTLLSSIKCNHELQSIKINPWNSFHLLLHGKEYLKVCKVNDSGNHLVSVVNKNNSKLSASTFVDALWLQEDAIALATANGDVFTIHDSQIRSSFSSIFPSEHRVTQMISCSQGFIVSSSGGQLVFFHVSSGGLSRPAGLSNNRTLSKESTEVASPKAADVSNSNTVGSIINNNSSSNSNSSNSNCDIYISRKCITGFNLSIVHCAISPNELTMLCLFSNNQLVSFSLHSDSTKNPDKEETLTVASSFYFHSGAIVGMDIAIRKPLVVSCSTNKVVHVWNYLDNQTEVIKYFLEELLSVAIHPMGFQIAIGFASKMRLYSIVKDDLLEECEIPIRNCRDIRYSHGGGLFAAVSGSAINIYSSITYNLMTSLRGHTIAGVKISWSHDDSKLLSCSPDGCLYEWKLESSTKSEESEKREYPYCCVCYNEKSTEALVCSSGGLLKQVSLPLEHQSTSFELHTNFKITCMDYCKSPALSGTNSIRGFVCCGSADGNIVLMPLPFPLHKDSDASAAEPSSKSTDTLKSNHSIVQHVHNGCVNTLRILPTMDTVAAATNYGNGGRSAFGLPFPLLFTAGEDGCIFLIKLFPTLTEIKSRPPSPYWNMLLISKGTLEELQQEISQLALKYKQQRANSEYMLHLKELQCEESLKKKEIEMEARLQQELARYQELHKVKQQQEVQAVDAMHNLEKEHVKYAEALEAQYEKKLHDLSSVIEDLKKSKEELRFQLEEKLVVVQRNHQEHIQQLQQQFQANLQEEAEKLTKLKKEMELLVSKHEQEFLQQEEEYEFEIAAVQERANKTISIERDNTMSLKGDNILLRRKCELISQENHSLQQLLSDKDKEISRLKKRIQEQEEAIEGLKKEVDERNITLGHKENRIVEVKQKNQELEKYRFVLDYKINELREELQPKDIIIADLKSQIKAMDEELQRTLQRSHQLDQQLTERNFRIESMVKESKSLKQQMAEKEKLIKLFVEDLHNLYTQTDSKEWKSGLKQLYQSYVTRDSNRRITKEDKERMQELARQRQYMEHSLGILKQKSVRGEERLKADVQRKVSENASLINELNALRRENWELTQKVILLENQLSSGAIKAAERLRGTMSANPRPFTSKSASDFHSAGIIYQQLPHLKRQQRIYSALKRPQTE